MIEAVWVANILLATLLGIGLIVLFVLAFSTTATPVQRAALKVVTVLGIVCLLVFFPWLKAHWWALLGLCAFVCFCWMWRGETQPQQAGGNVKSHEQTRPREQRTAIQQEGLEEQAQAILGTGVVACRTPGCNRTPLVSTARRTGGLCMPCWGEEEGKKSPHDGVRQ